MNDLKTLLRANGAFSTISGAVLLIGAGILDGAFGLDAWLLAVSGVGLIGYGASLWLAARVDDPVPAGRFASVMDIGWVLGAAIILLGFPTAMTTSGRITLLVVSLAVADFALLQIRSLRRSASIAA